MDWKLDLYQRIAPAIAPHAIVASNTSGLSITKLSEVLPEEIRPRFCGIHFFNPPRYMALVELIATPTTQPEILDQLEAFVTTALGKSVVRAKDTPNFIANRVGIAGMLATMKEAETFGLTLRRGRRPDRQEARPRQQRHLPHRRRGGPGHDGARHQDAAGQPRRTIRSSRATPRRRCWPTLIDARARSARRRGAGFYKKVGKDILRLDPAKGDYVPGGGKADEIVARMLKKPPAERLKLLRESKQPAGAVPVGDPARQLPLRRGAPRRHRRERARRRLRDALGLRHAARARSSCGSRPAGSRWPSGSRTTSTPARRCRRRRCRPGCSTARSRRRRAHARRLVERRRRARYVAPQQPAGLPAPALPRERARRRAPRRRCRAAPSCSRTTRSASGRSTARC